MNEESIAALIFQVYQTDNNLEANEIFRGRLLRLFSSDFFYVRVFNTRQWTDFRVLSTRKKTHHWKTAYTLKKILKRECQSDQNAFFVC